jgi:hypothetical protein
VLKGPLYFQGFNGCGVLPPWQRSGRALAFKGRPRGQTRLTPWRKGPACGGWMVKANPRNTVGGLCLTGMAGEQSTP